jgi:hypothetical protein
MVEDGEKEKERGKEREKRERRERDQKTNPKEIRKKDSSCMDTLGQVKWERTTVFFPIYGAITKNDG